MCAGRKEARKLGRPQHVRSRLQSTAGDEPGRHVIHEGITGEQSD